MTREKMIDEINALYDENVGLKHRLDAITKGTYKEEEGEWVRETFIGMDGKIRNVLRCPMCNITVELNSYRNYCPNCGKRIKGVKE